MDAMKTRSKTKFRIKFLVCFRPVTKDDSFKPRKQKDKPGPVLTYFVTADKETVALPSLLSPTLSTAGGDEAKNDCSRRKKCNVWQALKRALKETSLAKKIKKMKKTKDKSSKSNRNISFPKSDESILSRELSFDNAKGIINSNSSSCFPCSSAFTPSPLSSSASLSLSSRSLGCSSFSEMSKSRSLSRNTIEPMKQRQHSIKESGKGSYGSNTALCLLMVTLVVLVLWGKACAILCASIWLFLVPHRSLQHHRPPLQGQSEFDSVLYKKKVIMEGLLERSRSRVCMGSVTKLQGNES